MLEMESVWLCLFSPKSQSFSQDNKPIQIIYYYGLILTNDFDVIFGLHLIDNSLQNRKHKNRPGPYTFAEVLQLPLKIRLRQQNIKKSLSFYGVKSR